MIPWSWFTLNRQARGLTHFCVLYWFTLDYILIFQSLFFASDFLFWDTVHMSVSLHPDKLADIQQFALTLLQTQPVTICQVMSFLGKANFSANGHSQLQQLCHAIQSYMLTIILQPNYFLLYNFPLWLFIN